MKRKNYVLITGAIRSELYLRILLIRLCDLRSRAIIEKIVLSTWKGEIDKFEGLRDSLNELAIDLIESDTVDEVAETRFNKLGLVVQAATLRNALREVPNDCNVVKLRTDYNKDSKPLFDLLNSEKCSLELKSFGSFPIAFNKKLAIKIWGWSQLIFACDRFYYGSKEDLLKICLPIKNSQCRYIQMQVDNELVFSYTYHFYPLLRDIWDIIPLNFYDSLYSYCGKIKDDELNLPVILYRIYATMCVFVYTQIHLLDGNPQEDDAPVELIELFTNKIRTNIKIDKLVKGYIVETRAASQFKDELRKISLNLPECHTYTREEYDELKIFAKKKLNINIREYPFFECVAENQVKLTDKQKAANVLMGKYSDNVIIKNIINRIDDKLDSFAVFFQENKKYLNEDTDLFKEMLCMGVYESDVSCVAEYLKQLSTDKYPLNEGVWVSCLRYTSILNIHGINADKILATYYAIVKTNNDYFNHKAIRDNKWRLIDAVQNLMHNNLHMNIGTLPDILLPDEFVRLLVQFLEKNKLVVTKLHLEVLKALEIIHPKYNPFPDEIMEKLSSQGEVGFVERLLKKYETPFKYTDWFISNRLIELMKGRNLDSIIEYANQINGSKEQEALLSYFWSVYWQNIPYQPKISAVIESWGSGNRRSHFIMRAIKFLDSGELSVSRKDMIYRENFIILVELLYRKREVKKNYKSLCEVCLGEKNRQMLLQAFMRLETDERLDFFSMKHGNELWLYYLPYMKHVNSKKFEVPVFSSDMTWPGADRENKSAFAAYMKIQGNDIFVSIEISAKDMMKVKALAKIIGFDEKRSNESIIRFLVKRIPIVGVDGVAKAVNVGMDEFCKVGEKLVTALDQLG